MARRTASLRLHRQMSTSTSAARSPNCVCQWQRESDTAHKASRAERPDAKLSSDAVCRSLSRRRLLPPRRRSRGAAPDAPTAPSVPFPLFPRPPPLFVGRSLLFPSSLPTARFHSYALSLFHPLTRRAGRQQLSRMNCALWLRCSGICQTVRTPPSVSDSRADLAIVVRSVTTIMIDSAGTRQGPPGPGCGPGDLCGSALTRLPGRQ